MIDPNEIRKMLEGGLRERGLFVPTYQSGVLWDEANDFTAASARPDNKPSLRDLLMEYQEGAGSSEDTLRFSFEIPRDVFERYYGDGAIEVEIEDMLRREANCWPRPLFGNENSPRKIAQWQFLARILLAAICKQNGGTVRVGRKTLRDLLDNPDGFAVYKAEDLYTEDVLLALRKGDGVG